MSWKVVRGEGRLVEKVACFWRRRQALGGEYLRQALRGGEWLMEASVRWRRRYVLGEGRLLEKVARFWRRRQALGGGYWRQALGGGDWLMEASARWRRRYVVVGEKVKLQDELGGC